MPRPFRRPRACHHLRTAVLVLIMLASGGALAGHAPGPATAARAVDPAAVPAMFARPVADCAQLGAATRDPGGFDRAVADVIRAARTELAATRAALVRGLADAKKIQALVGRVVTTWSVRPRPSRRAGGRG